MGTVPYGIHDSGGDKKKTPDGIKSRCEAFGESDSLTGIKNHSLTGQERAGSNSEGKGNNNNDHDNDDKDDNQVDDDDNRDNEDKRDDDDEDNDNRTFQGGNTTHASCSAVHLLSFTLTKCAHRRKSRRAGMDNTCSLLEGHAPAMLR